MDRLVILATLVFALMFFIAREGTRLSKQNAYKIVIALYTFSCCFARLYIPYVNAGGEDSQGVHQHSFYDQ